MNTERQVYLLFSFCTILAFASWVVPRFVSGPGSGFAGAASAVMASLIMLGATFFLSLYLLIVAVREYSTFSATARVAGITPSVVLAAVLLGLFWFLAY